MKVVLSILLLISSFQLNAEVFTVTSNADSGSGSLRDALQRATVNGSIDPDFIYFNITGSTAAWSISVLTELPPIPPNITIDGTSQPGILTPGCNAKIALVRNAAEFFHGMVLSQSTNVKIYGMIFQNFKSAPVQPGQYKKGGIFLENTSNIIIGAPDKENVFTNNGIGIYSSEELGNIRDITVSSNYIGISGDGTSPVPNDNGIDFSYPQNITIGGPDPSYGNVVSSNAGIAIGCGGALGLITISNNFIGVNRTATRNYTSNKATGIFGSGDASVFTIRNNVICSQETGIRLENVNTTFTISGNYLGTGFTGTESYGNSIHGIKIYNCTNGGLIGGAGPEDKNIITNSDHAIWLERNTYPVTISRNSIYCNKKESIFFYQVSILPFPVTIDNVTSGGASGTYKPFGIIELFDDDNCPNGEGKTFIASVTADASGFWSYTGTASCNMVATGTVNGSTSAFSMPVLRVSSVTIGDSYCSANNGFINVQVTNATMFEWTNSSGQVWTTRNLAGVPAGVYKLKAGLPGGCFLEVSYTVPQKNITYAAISTTVIPETCAGSNGSIQVTSFLNDVPVSYKWLNSSGTQVGDSRDLTNMPAGTYTLIASNANGCENNAGVFTIPGIALTSIDTSSLIKTTNCDNTLVSAKGIKISGDTAPYSYEWRDENNQLAGKQADLSGVPPGNYTLTVTDKYNCSQTSGVIDLSASALTGITSSNSFSPNGDGINDKWLISGSENYPQGSFRIYNRYGELVFSSRGYASAFDGTRNGRLLPSGNYYYIIDLQNKNCRPISGSLLIIR